MVTSPKLQGQDHDSPALDPAPPLEVTSLPDSALMQAGIKANREHDYATAVLKFSQAIAVSPTDANAYYHRGFSYLRMGDKDHAIADFSQTIQLEPQSPLSYVYRAEIYANQGNRAEAQADLTSARQVASQKAQVYKVAAHVSQIIGDYPAAVMDFNQATSLAPQDPTLHNNFAWLLATGPEPGSRDGKRAVSEATTACNLTEWTKPGQIDTLAAAYAEAGDFLGAIKFEQQALSHPLVDPNNLSGMQARLTLYQAHQAYHQPSPTAGDP